jgi:hypothetical protein
MQRVMLDAWSIEYHDGQPAPPGTPEKPPTRQVYVARDGEMKKVRMSELVIGDVFALQDADGGFSCPYYLKAFGLPYLHESGYWAISANEYEPFTATYLEGK